MSINAFATGDPQNGFSKAARGRASTKTCPTDTNGGQGSIGDHSKAGSDFIGQPLFNNDGKNGRAHIDIVTKEHSCSISDLGKVLSESGPNSCR